MVFTLAIVLLLCGVLGDDQADKGPRVIWCQADMECRLAFWDPDVRCSQNRCTKQGKEVLQDGRKFFFFHLIILLKIIYIFQNWGPARCSVIKMKSVNHFTTRKDFCIVICEALASVKQQLARLEFAQYPRILVGAQNKL